MDNALTMHSSTDFNQQTPKVGDYLQAPRALGKQRLVVRAIVNECELIAEGRGRGRGRLSAVKSSWTELATAGFRLITYEEVQSARALVLMGSAAIVAFAATGCWEAGVATGATIVLFTSVAAASAHGLLRDWRYRMSPARRGRD